MTAAPGPRDLANPTIGKSGGASARYKTLDHWRGIACLIVVVHHTLLAMSDQGLPVRKSATHGLVTSAAFERTETAAKSHPAALRPRLRNIICNQLRIRVEMFFVISGYCIAASAESIRRSGGTVREYFFRRFMRIFPPFWCALAGSVLICFAIDVINPGSLKRAPWPLPMPWDLSLFQWVGSVTLTGTWIGFFTRESRLCFPIQQWTLCHETQFYVVIGILLALSGRRFFQAMAFLTAAVATIDFLALYYKIPIRGFFFDEYWFMFAAGVGLYWDLHCATSKQATTYRMIAWSALVGLTILATTATTFGQGSQFSVWRVVAALGFAFLLCFLKKYDERIASLSFLDGFKSCGVICYSIYLTHLFPTKILIQQLSYMGYQDDWSLVFVCIPLTLTMSVLLGYVFHVLVERWFLSGRYDLVGKLPRSTLIKTFDKPREPLAFNQFHRTAPSNPSGKEAA
jgi:peptidoglycan/LPS O-acetylase OafA/YrhL